MQGSTMRLAALLTGLALMAPGMAMAAPERRCGWLQNPTPANWWLRDRDGEWVLSVQGGPPVPGMDEVPDMTTRGWVATNGPYGYGCACFTLEVDRAARQVLRVISAEPLPLQRCRGDRALPAPG
jgi:hypothetical protein